MMKLPENFKRAIQDRKTIPFVGAGVSMAVKVETNGTKTALFPSWIELLDRAAQTLDSCQKEKAATLVRAFLDYSPPNYLEAARYACDAFALDDWYEFLKRNFDKRSTEPVEGLELARAIWSLSNGLVITTNYDNVLSWACPHSRDINKWFIQSPVQQAEFLRRTLDRPTVWHLHGGIDQPETIILTPDGYSRLYPCTDTSAADFDAALQTLQSVMREYTLIFIGYSMTDKEIADQLRLMSEIFNGATGHHFILVRESDYDSAQAQLSRFHRLVELVRFPEFGPALAEFIEHLAALKNETPQRSPESRASTDITPIPKLAPRPVLDKSAFSLFIGRERLLEDIRTALAAVIEKESDRWLDYRSAYVQLFWIHGHGGMGKSWLLRRAYIEAEERYPAVHLALIDWDAPKWREPLSQPPIDSEQLFKVIAHRLAQLFGANALQRYWSASIRVQAAKERFIDLQLAFRTTLERVVIDRSSDTQGARSAHANVSGEIEADQERKYRHVLEEVLRAFHLWSDQSEVLNQRMKELLADPIRKQRVFEEWGERVTEASADAAVYQPGKVLSEALRDCIREITADSTLVLILDTCELLPPEVDWWLRHLLAPLLDGNTSLLAIVGSRQRPDVNNPEGRSEGWIAEVPDRLRRIVPFDEAVRFTVDEIGAALRKLRRPPPESFELAQQLHQVTLGVPLALRALFDFHEDGDDVLSQIAFSADNPDVRDLAAMDRVYEMVSKRFLLHLMRERREEELRDITALALFRQARVDILKRLWNCASIRERVRNLEMRYSLVSDGDLHEMVRKFLRRYWRTDVPQLVLDVASALRSIVEAAEPAGTPEELDYFDWMLDRCEIASWLEGEGAFGLFARTLAVALAFDHGAHTLGALAAEIPTTSREGTTAKKHLTSLADDYYYFSSFRMSSSESLQWLNQQQTNGWTEIERASLDLLNGLSLNKQSRHAEAIQRFHRAFPLFVEKGVPRRYEVAQAYLNSVQASGQSMVALAQEACEWANRLGFIDGNLWNVDYYWAIHNARKYEEAESYCRNVIENYPHSFLAYAFLGHILADHLDRPKEAEETFRQGIEFGQGLEIGLLEPTIQLFLGDLLTKQERFEEAETEYRRTLEMVVDEEKSRVLVRLATVLQSLNRPDEALEVYREAGRYDSDDPYTLNEIAWRLYSANIELEEAEQAAKQAVANSSEEIYLYSLQTLAAILVRLNKWSEAKPKVERWVQLKDLQEFKKSWHDFQPLFHDAAKNGHSLELADLLNGRTENSEFYVLQSVLREIGGESDILNNLPSELQNAAAELKEQILSNSIPSRFPEFPQDGETSLLPGVF